MQRLAVFDIDGTLTDTNAVDDECYVRAVGEVLEVDAHLLDWSEAPHVTDSGLLHWLAQRHSRSLTPHVQEAVLARFLELLRGELARNPHRFRAVTGAQSVRHILERNGWRVAVATGGWAASAHLKLEAIGFDTTDLGVVTSSDAFTRTEIVALAARRTSEIHGGFDRIVSVGDAVWDVQTAATVGWPFVGIADGDRSDRLRSAGAATILQDFADEQELHDALLRATIPTMANAKRSLTTEVSPLPRDSI